MTRQVYLATNNAKKLRELARIVAEAGLTGVQVLSPAEVPAYPEPAETEWTFEGNALIKARAGAAATGMVTLADDSGLCVDALGGMPGVRSSRWAGPECDDSANLELVLRQIDDVAPPRRTASFVSVMALATPDGFEAVFRGEMPGVVVDAPRGDNGFGYDPIFMAADQPTPSDASLGACRRTNAELSAAEKDAISHRGKAIRALLPTLAKALGMELPGDTQ
ncbi:MAG: RdgB/HAM1 family non-canonical purine NTP pyrophosphatase [Propionibacteriaceae bacterium]|jgi:XTP/dITP diphosphohydrolase|nr:RdgB/HAM1 family non-canonical purine NTP pyrophosphatase [Propionibacteriaceae bacterium]